MAKAPGLIVDEDLVAQEFDMEDLLGVDLSSDETLAAEIGQDIVQFIQDRAADNKGIGGKALKSPYSKAYSKTTEFELAGKSPGDVNMRLTGDMLDSIEVLGFDNNVLTVGIEGGEAPKAHGHMTGKNGEVPAMKREFFGLTEKEFQEIVAPYQDRIDQLAQPEASATDILTESENLLIDRAFETIGDLFDFEQEG